MIDLHPAVLRTTEVLASISEDQFDRPTPCTTLNVGDLVEHLRGVAVRLACAVRRNSKGGGTPSERNEFEDPAGGWRDGLARDLADLADAWWDPSVWEGTARVMGALWMPAKVLGLVALDEVVVHGWDLAAAVGQPYAPTATEVAALTIFVAKMKVPRDGSLFGPVVVVADNGLAFDRLLGLTGRDPQWAPPGGVGTARP